MTEKRKETPQERYQKKYRVSFIVPMMKTTEADLIEWMKQQPNKSGYIKSLIRADMEKQKK